MFAAVVATVAAALAVAFAALARRLRAARGARTSHSGADEGAVARKARFVEAAGGDYGYGGSPGGHIDGWRAAELPTLVGPLGSGHRGGEVYLDYAGAALATRSQLLDACDAAVLGNPHASGGPAAERAAACAEAARRAVLRHVGATNAAYDVVWTSGATAALKLVADLFPWREGATFWYDPDAHTSVVGVRYVAADRGAAVVASDEAPFGTGGGGLFAASAESNFDGARRDVRPLVLAAKAAGFLTLVDVSKASSAGPVDLEALGSPDFACLSLYKIFGTPTGLGCLVGAAPALRALVETKRERGFAGGGTLDRLCAVTGYRKLKARPADALDCVEINHWFGASPPNFRNL